MKTAALVGAAAAMLTSAWLLADPLTLDVDGVTYTDGSRVTIRSCGRVSLGRVAARSGEGMAARILKPWWTLLLKPMLTIGRTRICKRKMKTALVVLLYGISIFPQASSAQSQDWDAKTRDLVNEVLRFDSRATVASRPSAEDVVAVFGQNPQFLQNALRGLAGVQTIQFWGAVLTKPYSKVELQQVLSWRMHPDSDVRYTVFQILNLYAEDPKSPAAVEEVLAPILAEKSISPDPEAAINGKLDELKLILKVRSPDNQQAIDATLSELGFWQHELCALRLLSMFPTPKRLVAIRQRRRAVNGSFQHYDVAIEIAELNSQLTVQEKRAQEQTLERAVLDKGLTPSTRSFALWQYYRSADRESIPFILKTYKTHGKAMPVDLRSHFWSVIEAVDRRPAVKDELRALGLDPNDYRFKRPQSDKH